MSPVTVDSLSTRRLNWFPAAPDCLELRSPSLEVLHTAIVMLGEAGGYEECSQDPGLQALS
eukprot:9967469-Prorocentrum_lima.AAC.1